jgi:hypothetical protein
MKSFAFVASVVLLGGVLALAGCGAVGGGKTVVKYDEGSTPIETKAPQQGSYALYSTTDYNPQIVVTLSEGDNVGFRKGEGGQLIAVAGSREIPLQSNKTYYWKRQ